MTAAELVLELSYLGIVANGMGEEDYPTPAWVDLENGDSVAIGDSEFLLSTDDSLTSHATVTDLVNAIKGL